MKTICQAGYVLGENHWLVVGKGETIEQARDDLKKTIAVMMEREKVSLEYIESHRYIETGYTA